MKILNVFKNYAWLLSTIYNSRRITLSELNERWRDSEMGGGDPLSRTSFKRYKEAIQEMFGIVIECDASDDYRYYIVNREELRENKPRKWMLDTLSVSVLISESLSLHNRILLETMSYDEDMLRMGNYPQFLKDRITSPRGHLSNKTTAKFLAQNMGPDLKYIWLCHLSGENNHPEIAYKTVEYELRSVGIIPGMLFYAGLVTVIRKYGIENDYVPVVPTFFRAVKENRKAFLLHGFVVYAVCSCSSFAIQHIPRTPRQSAPSRIASASCTIDRSPMP